MTDYGNAINSNVPRSLRRKYNDAVVIRLGTTSSITWNGNAVTFDAGDEAACQHIAGYMKSMLRLPAA